MSGGCGVEGPARGRHRRAGLMAPATVLPGKAERALRYEFVCKIGGPPEFRYCNGEWSKQVENVSGCPRLPATACCPRFAACVPWKCSPHLAVGTISNFGHPRSCSLLPPTRVCCVPFCLKHFRQSRKHFHKAGNRNLCFFWQVVIDDLPFAEGALRACYRMQVRLSMLACTFYCMQEGGR